MSTETTTGQEMFNIRFKDIHENSMATSIQCCIPQGLSYYQAKEYLYGRIVSELASYALQECLARFDLRPGGPL